MRKKRICTEFNQVERNGGEEGGRRMDVCGEIATQLENVNIVDRWRMDQAKESFELGLSKTKRRR